MPTLTLLPAIIPGSFVSYNEVHEVAMEVVWDTLLKGLFSQGSTTQEVHLIIIRFHGRDSLPQIRPCVFRYERAIRAISQIFLGMVRMEPVIRISRSKVENLSPKTSRTNGMSNTKLSIPQTA